MAAEYLFVVARDQLELYGYLRRTFAGDERFQVILDQRAEERRQRPEERDLERRRIERRTAPNVATNLPDFGFAIIRLRY
jgi:hypothetical protein